MFYIFPVLTFFALEPGWKLAAVPLTCARRGSPGRHAESLLPTRGWEPIGFAPWESRAKAELGLWKLRGGAVGSARHLIAVGESELALPVHFSRVLTRLCVSRTGVWWWFQTNPRASSASAANGGLTPVNSLAVQPDGLTTLWGCQNTGIIVYRQKTAYVGIGTRNLLEFVQKEPVASVNKGWAQQAPSPREGAVGAA